MKKLIRLTESELHRLVNESVRKILREHDPDDPDYGQYGDYYDAMRYKSDCEHESGLYYWLNPSNNQIVEDGEEEDGYLLFVVIPEFGNGDEYGFHLTGFYFEFDTGSEKNNRMLEKQYGDLINNFIDDNYDELYSTVKNESDYTIY